MFEFTSFCFAWICGFCCVKRFSVKPFSISTTRVFHEMSSLISLSHSVSLGIKSRCGDSFEPLDLYMCRS